MAKDNKPLAPPHPAKPGSAAEADEAARAAESNRRATGGYDQTKGPEGKDEHKTKIVSVSDDEIRDAVNKVVDGFKGRAGKEQVVGVLRSAADMLYRGSWAPNKASLDYDPDDLDDPRANPQGLRPSPLKATRADEHTAPEPDSEGSIADRKAAEAGINDEEDDLTDVPPADREAVATKRAAQKSVDQFGTAGGSPLARAERAGDPASKKR